MFFYHADDYGINIEQSKRILDCRENGCLNSVSIIATSPYMEEAVKMLDEGCRKAVHINLCEGKAILSADQIPLLVDEKGFFKRSFISMLLLSVLQPGKLEKQVAKECYAQLLKVIALMPKGYRLRVDSHRHYHMIPGVLRGLLRAIKKTGLEVEYIRLPMEDWALYFHEPKLWPKIRFLSIIKAVVLNTCGNFNKRLLKKCGLLDKTCKYVGVIFTDEMFLDRIQPLVKRIEKDRRYRDKEVELQFHPGGIKKGEYFLDEQFEEWFESSNREGEAKTLKCLKVNQNAE